LLGDRDAGFVAAAPLGDAMEVALEPVAAVVAGDGFERGPAHQPGTHLGD
jgi:hypothetical protein